MQVHTLAHTLAQMPHALLTNKHSQVWSEAFPWKSILGITSPHFYRTAAKAVRRILCQRANNKAPVLKTQPAPVISPVN